MRERRPAVIRVQGVFLWLDRPDHPHADNGGYLLCAVHREWRGSLPVITASTPYGTTWLTTAERAEAEEALRRRDDKLERGDTSWA